MDNSDICTTGVLEGRTIQLDRTVSLPSGSRVNLVIRRPPMSREEMLRLADDVCGSCADDPSFGEAVERIVFERFAFPLKEVDFDSPP